MGCRPRGGGGSCSSPGLGKSRLAAEAAGLAGRRGVLTAWGRCRETEGAPAFWPWTQVLRLLREGLGAAAWERALGPDGDWLGPVLPELAQGERSVDPFRTYDSMARALARVAADRAVVLIFDDLHSADPGSLRMLRFVAGELDASRIVIIGTYRDEEVPADHLLAQLVGELATSRAARILALDGLDRSGVEQLIASIVGAPVDPALAERVRERTAGNPFFVGEVARLGLDGPVPIGVREAIRARVRRLPEPTRAALSAASVLGRDFGGEVLESVSSLHGVSLVAALQPAAQARVITSDPERQGRYRFVHALVQEVLYTDLPEDVRRATHDRAARALDELAAPRRLARIEELAFHACSSSRDGASRARASALSEEAGARAASALACEDAARWYARAIEIAPEGEPAARLLELLFGQADAMARTPNGAEARRCYEAAFDLALRSGDGPAAARAALGVGQVVVSAGVIDQPLIRMLEQADRLLGRDDVASIRIEARVAIELYWQRDPTPARSTAARALARAEDRRDSRALGAAIHARRFVLRGPGDLEERIALGQRLVGLATATRDEELELSACAWLIPELMAAGDMVAVDRTHAALDGLERRVRRPLARWYVLLFEGMRAAFEGRFEEALAIIDRGESLGRRVGSQPASLFASAQRAVVLRELGRGAESIRPLRDLAATYPLLVTLQCELALFLAEAGETAEAGALLEQVAHDGFAAVPRDSLWRASIALAAQAAATLGQVATARAAGALLGPFAGINVVQGVPVAWGASDHFIGVAEGAAGDLDAAVASLETAVRLHAAWGAMALRASSQAELANALRQRGRAQDRGRVLGLEATVRAEAGRLGLRRPLLTRERLAARDPAQVTRAPDRLTPSEARILGLLCRGSANKEIAEALRISVHTVERHLANLYGKIGARNRADAAAFAVTRGMGGNSKAT